MVWIILGVAVLSEKLLAFVMRDIAAGTAYAVWTGLGAAGVVIFGALLFGEELNAIQMIFVGLIIIGVVGAKIFASA